MSKKHPMAQSSALFGISPKLQEIMCLLGQAYVFDEAEEVLDQTLGLNISAKQIQRVSEHYGEAIEDQQIRYVNEEETPALLKQKNKQEPVYMMPDGSMIYTREEGWKEIKVGRLFSKSDTVAVQPSRNQITQSIYVCHLGTHHDFLEKWDAYTRNYKHKICIGDGAKWIWNWVEDTCPQAIQILDFYHAIEKLSCYAAWQYPDKRKRRKWMKEQKQRLLDNKVEKIIYRLKRTQGRTPEAEKTKNDVLSYYQNNKTRMQYKTYKEKGYLIGSGAIEAAHRNVVQQRLKLSGQRWSVKGAQQIVNLRAYKKSNRWQEVVQLIKIAA